MRYDFDNPWAMDKSECDWLSSFCYVHGVLSVLEFGPGNSTAALLDAGVSVLHSFEENPGRAMVIRNRFPDIVRVIDYNPTESPILVELNQAYDLAVIDGPSGSSVTPPRINSAMFSFERADMLLFHDSKRDFETIKIMIDLGMEPMDSFDSERGIVVLKHHDY
jgi:hypothetical protein